MTWEAIVALEPRLLNIEARILTVDVNDLDFNFWHFWSRECKEEFWWLVGWRSKQEILSTSAVYDVVQTRLFNLLYERTQKPKEEEYTPSPWPNLYNMQSDDGSQG